MEAEMRYRVVCFYQGVWDGKEAVEHEATSEMDAAEAVCGTPLVEAGKPGQLRAQVTPTAAPAAKKLFYMPPTPM
jgi:hypothetical protein